MLRTPDGWIGIGARGPKITKDCFLLGGRYVRLWRHQVELSTVFCSGEQYPTSGRLEHKRVGLSGDAQTLVGNQCAASMTSAAFSAII